MSQIKGDNKTEQKHFDYLEALRQSGSTNMWGAGAWLERAFPAQFKKQKASEVLIKWMKRHGDPQYDLGETK